MEHKLQALLNQIDFLKSSLDALQPWPQHSIASLRDKLALEWVCNAGMLHDSPLTLIETKVVLEGITVAHRSLQEHLATLNRHTAFMYIASIAVRDTSISEKDIAHIHHIARRLNAGAGEYRNGVSIEMRRLLAWHQAVTAMHPVQRAAQLCTRFLKIHSFVTCNELIGRLLLTYELLRAGYPIAVLRASVA